jgi:hypothetical protein
MTGKEIIFSPGHMDENPFKYLPHLKEQQNPQMQHLNKMNLQSSDSHPESPAFEPTENSN